MAKRYLFLGGPLDGLRLYVARFAFLWSRIGSSEIGAVNREHLAPILESGTYHRVSVPARLTDASLTKPLDVVCYRHHSLSDLEALSLLIARYPESAACSEPCRC